VILETLQVSPAMFHPNDSDLGWWCKAYYFLGIGHGDRDPFFFKPIGPMMKLKASSKAGREPVDRQNGNPSFIFRLNQWAHHGL
jgi:hypothetical protein